MPVVQVMVHPRGLHPLQAARAFHLHEEEGMTIRDICKEVTNMSGEIPSVKGVWNAIQTVKASQNSHSIGQTKYGNCGRKRTLTQAEEKAVTDFVHKWRNKRFCTCSYIRSSLKLKVTIRTVSRVLNRNGYFWKPLPKVRGLSAPELAKRKAWIDKFIDKSPAWWQANFGLVLDGVTLTMAPTPLSARQRHMAQSIKHAWLREGEEPSSDCYHFNKYGVQLGVKVPLWGGFTGQGRFTFRAWTQRPKMTKEEWAARVPHISRSVSSADSRRGSVRAKVWHDNEKFLLQPKVYRAHGLQMECFPPNSGDLNPIETVWAWLRRDLARKEQEDFAANRAITAQQFRQRVAHILHGYEAVRPGQEWSMLSKLVRGMPKRLRKSKAKQYGRCGK
jgi:transposase